jgi:ABC-type branched-subunit amino acid transport system ATPase component
MKVAPTQPILRAEDIRRLYGASYVLNGVSLSLFAGSLTLLTGRNGSGKSTLINCLTGFDRAHEGEVLLFDKSVKRKGADERARLGVVRTFQYPHLFSSLTVHDNLSLGRKAHCSAFYSYFKWRWRDNTLDGDVLMNSLSEFYNRQGAKLSFGEMKLVNTARAFMTGAKVLLLDEPLASLHGRKRQEMLEAICQKRRDGCALLVIEHDMPDLINLADAVYELREGRIVEQ